MSRTSRSHWLGLLVGTLFSLAFSSAAQPGAKGSPEPTSGHIEVPADHRARRSAPPLKLYYERLGGPRSGKKPAIVLHGGPGHAPPMIPILQGSEPGRTVIRHYDLLYFHQRGSGRSLLPEEAKLEYVIQHKNRYTMDQYVEDIEVIRSKVFGPKTKVTLIGSSWGGFSGLAYAVKHQRHVEALILGSFEATGSMGGSFCQNIDQALFTAEAEFPALRASLTAFRGALSTKKIIWHRGKKNQRVLAVTDIIEVALPLATKARYPQLATLLMKLTQGDRQAQAFLDKLELDEMATAGGSVPGTATYCQELVNKRQLEAAVHAPPPALNADCRKVNQTFLKLCSPFLSDHFFNVEKELPRLSVPALLLAGRWDPALPWQSTARTAAKMRNATFLLIKGGHTPFDEGGACFAKIIASLAARRYTYDLSCL